MSKVTINNETLTNIANSIRSKSGGGGNDPLSDGKSN